MDNVKVRIMRNNQNELLSIRDTSLSPFSLYSLYIASAKKISTDIFLTSAATTTREKSVCLILPHPQLVFLLFFFLTNLLKSRTQRVHTMIYI